MRTSEMRLWSIKEENRHGLDQVRPLRLETIYGLVAGEANLLLTMEVDITVKCYQ